MVKKGEITNISEPGYKRIRVHMVYDVKHDGRHKARLVADGNLTQVPVEAVYSGVVSLRGLRLVAFSPNSTNWSSGEQMLVMHT
jgi:hypothetical protein